MYTFESLDLPEIEKYLKNGKTIVRSFFGQHLLINKPTESDYTQKSILEKCNFFLETNKTLFGLDEIKWFQPEVSEGSVTASVSYLQHHNNIPVKNSQIVVGLNKTTSEIISVINQLNYEIPKNLNLESVLLSSNVIIRKLLKLFGFLFSAIRLSKPQLLVYQHTSTLTVTKPFLDNFDNFILSLGQAQENTFYLVWEIKIRFKSKEGFWEILVDATNGKIITVTDLCKYATSSACIFKPDPVTKSGIANLSVKTSSTNTLNSLQDEVTLKNLKTPTKLEGDFIVAGEFEGSKGEPKIAALTTTTNFKYEVNDCRFQNVMAYYWLDTITEYLRQFGVPTYNNSVSSIPLNVDAQADKSVFIEGNKPWILLCPGNTKLCNCFPNSQPSATPVERDAPDATDAHVIIHEYGHAIHWYMKKRQMVGESHGIEEGFGDFLAGVWLDRYNPNVAISEIRNNVFPWINNTSTPQSILADRKFDTPLNYDSPGIGGHKLGSVLAAALWNIYLKIGGSSANPREREIAADTLIKLYLEMLVCITPNLGCFRQNSSFRFLGNALINTDKQLNNGVGVNEQAIRDGFAFKNIPL